MYIVLALYVCVCCLFGRLFMVYLEPVDFYIMPNFLICPTANFAMTMISLIYAKGQM